MMELVATYPVICSNKNLQHDTDAFKELHGTLEAPIPVPVKDINKYVASEYELISKEVGIYHRCMQQLFKDHTATPMKSVDRLVVRDMKGSHHVYYFDISEPINADTLLMEQAWADMQAGKPVDPARRKLLERAVSLQKHARERR